ncbi:thiamine pyrophosphate-binding protein [Terrarubrum flagellatum]|uniref:thiamine pyrophosphate-binding protein n=1 Tax=Terrirubrum flagellatum TaxID=2895980 RepID=UPI0031451383
MIARRLAEAGCRFAFGMPGGEVAALVDALDEAGLRFVLTKHENAGGFMAEGTWHETGAPAVLVATLGPGVANAANVVANAQQDRVPLIFLTGRADPAEAESFTHQIFDHQALLRPIVKASLAATSGAVATVIEKALAIALDGQPGPVHVDVPIGVAESEERATEIQRRAALAPAAPAPGLLLNEARELLRRAERPIMIAGLDAVNQNASAAISEFCRRFNTPLITTYKAKGLLPESDPLSLFGAGLSPKADKILLPLLAQSDCIILAGYDPIEMRIGWRNPWPADAPVIEISAVSQHHFMHANRIAFTGDVGATLAALSRGLPPRPTWPADEPASARRALEDAFAIRSERFGPDHVFAMLRRVLPQDMRVTIDSGAHRILMSQMWRCEQPRTLIQSTGLCTMGCALPLAAGLSIASGDKAVAVMGDAGLEMVIGELATIRDLKLPLLLVVLVDESLELIALKQRASNRAPVGVHFGGTDFPAVARAYGGEGVWIDDVPALEKEIAAALDRSNRFTLLAARIGRNAYDGRF